MTALEVARLAAAIATANGHSEPDAWAEKVVEAFEKSAPPTEPPVDPKKEG